MSVHVMLVDFNLAVYSAIAKSSNLIHCQIFRIYGIINGKKVCFNWKTS